MNKRILSFAVAGVILASTVVATLPLQTAVHAATPAASSTSPVDFTVTSNAPGRLVHMTPVNDTKTHGVATFVYDPLTKSTIVTVAAIGLPSGGKFFPVITSKRCGADGSVVYQLPDMTATPHYAGASAGVLGGTWQAKNWHISLYRKAGALGLQRWSVSCANV
jgi:hypothetical protein